jgi:hypothetical protein
VPIELPAATHEAALLGWTTSPRTAVKLSVEEYLRLIDSGVLPEGEPVELLEGIVTRKMIKNPRHSAVTDALYKILTSVTPAGWFVSSQNPVTTADSVPEPDLKVVRGKPADFSQCHPAASDLALVVEVADTSLKQDRTTKQRIYAKAKIPIYWIVNLIDDVVEVYTVPTSRPKPHYKSRTDFSQSQRIQLVLDGKRIVSIKVEDFLL